jgi:tight adherence protein B
MRTVRAVLIATFVLAACASPAAASGIRLTPAKEAAFPHRSYLLTLPSRVNLTSGQVSITENGVRVRELSVTPASAVGQEHFGTVLLIETSASMRSGALNSAMSAARAFAQHLAAQQPLGVVEFDSTSRVALPLTTDQTLIARTLNSTPAVGSGTHIYSAVSTGLQMLAQANVTAGAIILLSDGAITGRLSEQASKQRKAQVISGAHAQNVRVYAIGIHDRAFSAANLQSLTAATGGTYAEVNSAGLPALLRQLGAELSNEYLVSYRSVAALGTSVSVVAQVAGQQGTGAATYTTPALAPAPPPRPPAKHTTSFWRSTTAAVLVCVLCALLVGFAAMSLLAPMRSVRRRVGNFVAAAGEETKSWTGTLLDRAFSDTASRRHESQRWSRMAREVELAAIGVSLEQVAALTALATVLLGWLLVASTASPLAALLALSVPVGVHAGIRVKAGRQRRAFDEQLPDNLQVVAAAMRAGHTFVGALAIVTEDAAEPSRRELRRVLSDEQLGVPLADALSGVTERMDSRDFEHVALVAALQRETGGNTAEVIDTATETIRERLDLRRLVSTLTAQGRISGWIVAALPVALLMAVSLINPGYVDPLFHRAVGILFLVIGAVMDVCGFLVIRRIVNIKV